jgi:hypothetical protein
MARRCDGLFPSIASFANLHLAWRKAARCAGRGAVKNQFYRRILCGE